MSWKRAIIAFALVPSPLLAAAAGPFKLPVRAKVLEEESAKGWLASGEARLAFEQAKMQFAIRLEAAGWRLRHAIALGEGRELETWTRGQDELTLMLWRISSGRSGFSYGLSRKSDG